jgi:hypothetical protein
MKLAQPDYSYVKLAKPDYSIRNLLRWIIPVETCYAGLFFFYVFFAFGERNN